MRHLFAIAFGLLLTSCANYKLHISGDPVELPPSQLGEPEYTIYLIGDAGDCALGEVPPAVEVLGRHLETAPKNSAIVFLGDNIYPAGLPPKNDTGRELAEHRLQVQLDILKNFKGKPFFIPGNHGWYQKQKRKGIERQEDFVEEYLQRGGDVWVPDNGCGDVVTEELSQNVVGLFVDSEWYIMDWNKERALNEGCEIKSRESFYFYFQEALKKNRRKRVVVFMHHPIYSNGPHGGRFSVKQHLFPLTDIKDNLYIPLPGLGTMLQFLRATVGHRTDIAFPLYRELSKMMEQEARKHGSFILASGHEHNLQYFEVEGQSVVISGAGSKSNPVAGGRGLQFGYGKEPGFSVLKIYPEGETYLEFWVAGDGKGKGRRVFSRKIKDKLAAYEQDGQETFSIYESGVDSMIHTLNPNVPVGGLHRWMWGERYRTTYRTPVKAPVLDLRTWKGGVTPIKRGGGGQTNALRVEDGNGLQYVLRDMLKDETRMVPYPFNKTFAKGIFADVFTASNPYVPLVISALAEAAGVYHTNPKLYFIPKQPTLGNFNDSFGGKFYLVEERTDGDWSHLASFGNSEDLVSTLDLVANLEKNHHHRVDGPAVVRARLFDNMIGDWDRHDDNWRWASFPEDDSKIVTYRPIPRDRDQAFSNWDGAIPALLRFSIPLVKELMPYGGRIKNIKWLNYNGMYFDATFLNEPDWQVWEREAKLLHAKITDEVIERSLEEFPKETRNKDTDWITPKLKQRRDEILTTARRLYLLVSDKVVVSGTNDHDFFLVERLDDERTRVRIYDCDKNGVYEGAPYYERTLLRSETKEVWLYGLEDEDYFLITGQVNKGILVRCIGGLAKDNFRDESSVKGASRKTHFYDTEKGNMLHTGTEAANRTSDNPVMNTKDRRSFDYEHNFGMGLPLIVGNSDDGLALGGVYVRTTYGFHRSPYATRHTFFGQYALATSSYELTYSGEFIGVLKHWDLVLDAVFQGPLYTRNFYGFGNNTPNWPGQPQTGVDFVRVRQEHYGVYPALRCDLANHLTLSLGSGVEVVKVDSDPSRFVNRDNPQLFQSDFDNNYFSGAEAQINFFNVDNIANPTTGISFNATAGLKKQLSKGTGSFPYYQGHLGIYLGGRRLVFASKISAQHVGDGFRFYQAATLGARNNLRGYRNERFSGETAVAHQNDLRLRLFNVDNGFLPFTVGIFAGYDYGQVWYGSDQNNNGWHDAEGGGIWLSPLDLAVITFSYFNSDDGGWFQFKGGFSF